jgi:glycosyltransferase involved in cell wall biosynthesis
MAHAQTLLEAGHAVAVVTGSGEVGVLPQGTELICVPEINSQHPEIVQMSAQLDEGEVPPDFEAMTRRLSARLASIVGRFDNLIVHNVFTKHFNLPLTAALYRLLDEGGISNCIAWCHDFTWTSPSSGSKVRPGYPWDLLRTSRPDVTYVVVSRRRQRELASLFGCAPEQIHVIYNGVEPRALLGLTAEGHSLVNRLGLLGSDLVLLMPVRVTRAKNIEYALQVVAALKARACRPKLVLTGPPDPHDAESMAYFHSLQDLRQELDIEEEMHFVFESGPDPSQGLIIDVDVVGDLYRVSDLMFMPSHREGFAMPVLEAGLAGVPVVCTEVPAAMEIGGADLMLLSMDDDPVHLAERILDWADHSPVHRLRRRVRQNYTWQAIFRRDIEPLLHKQKKA